VGKGGRRTLSADGSQLAQGRIERSDPIRYSLDEGLDVGEDTGTPVSLDYDVPFKFTGVIKKVVIDLGKSGLSAADEKSLEESKKKALIVRE
jgi:arylsulfatase